MSTSTPASKLGPVQALRLRRATRSITQELARASVTHSPFNSTHEALSVILEEADELKVAIRRDYDPLRPMSCTVSVRREAKHLAAMCLRLLVEDES